MVQTSGVKFSIATPSLGQLPWLQRCVRSVADQRVDLEHLVQDAGTGPALEEWLGGQPQVRLAVEPDGGMYDALNRAFARASGEVFAWLNCDEQYLPGTLKRVRDLFTAQPETDLVVGHHLLVDERGELRGFRRATKLRASMILTDHLYAHSCAIFFRRRVFERTGPFSTAFRVAGDAEWVARAIRGAEIVYVDDYLATFTLLPGSLSASATAEKEARRLRVSAPLWARALAPVLREWRHVEKWRAGGYTSRPIAYEIFAGEDDLSRTRYVCERPDFRHPREGEVPRNISAAR